MEEGYRRIEYGEGAEKISVIVLDELYNGNIMGLIKSEFFSQEIGIIFKPMDDNCISQGEITRYGDIPVIVFYGDIFEEFKQQTDKVLTIIFHELGHLHNGDIEAVTRLDSEGINYDEQRRNATESGNILDIEVGADDFAAKYLGADKVISGLSAIKEHNKAFSDFDNYDLCDMEIDRRIERLRQKQN